MGSVACLLTNLFHYRFGIFLLIQDVSSEPECEATHLGGVLSGETQPQPNRVHGQGTQSVQGAKQCHQCGNIAALTS